jgi:hypothetical protein
MKPVDNRQPQADVKKTPTNPEQSIKEAPKHEETNGTKDTKQKT